MSACLADDCEDPVRSKNATLCEKHYMRMRRNGTLHRLTKSERKRPVRRPVPRDEARDSLMVHLYASGMSTTDVGTELGLHASQVSRVLRRMGVMMRPARRKRLPVVTYSGAHMRVRADRGNANLYLCACGKHAEQWAYSHTDPDERSSEFGPFSITPSFYEPKCVPCHKKSDLERIRNQS